MRPFELSYAEEHSSRCRAAQNAKGVVTAAARDNPIDFVEQFFGPGMRQKRAWRSAEIAREVAVPMPIVAKAMQAARDAGLVELVDGRWNWRS